MYPYVLTKSTLGTNWSSWSRLHTFVSATCTAESVKVNSTLSPSVLKIHSISKQIRTQFIKIHRMTSKFYTLVENWLQPKWMLPTKVFDQIDPLQGFQARIQLILTISVIHTPYTVICNKKWKNFFDTGRSAKMLGEPF